MLQVVLHLLQLALHLLRLLEDLEEVCHDLVGKAFRDRKLGGVRHGRQARQSTRSRSSESMAAFRTGSRFRREASVSDRTIWTVIRGAGAAFATSPARRIWIFCSPPSHAPIAATASPDLAVRPS